MAPSKLNDEQQAMLIRWIAEGLNTAQINERSALFDPPFVVSPQLKSYYFHDRREAIREQRQKIQDEVFNEGLALAEERTKRLLKLAKMLEDDLFEKRLAWLDDVKGIGTGKNYERVTFEQFNAAEIKELRAIYDDIAKETNGRIKHVDLTSKGKAIKTYESVSPDEWDESHPGPPSDS